MCPTLLRWLVAGVLSAALAGCAADKIQTRPGTTTTVILTRHADTEPGSGELNGTGRERAKALIDTVGDMRITANRLGIEITRTAAVGLFAADSIAREMLDKHAGGVILWVGNVSGNLQAVYRRLGGPGMGPVEYGDLHILRIADNGPGRVVKKRYGPEP